mmetsp:Transcript_33004/g.85584  ORF Transcript_33004/g.85584 Transcript_33004/m.85584 type:complete len:328 (+) Transcript_33004:365-1348(+)|eukprot:jgi/Tetstr1/466847/TSEL_011304.t1
MGAEDRKLVQDTGAFLLNVTSAVAIIFFNKKLMGIKDYGFNFATTLSAIHFLTCSASMTCGKSAGLLKKEDRQSNMPTSQLLLFVLTASTSIVSLNVSLMINAVGTYQVAKLLIIPTTCFLEMIVFRSATFTVPMLLAMAVVLFGVGVVTVTDVEVNHVGLMWAAVSVVSSALQQIFCGSLQRKFRISSHDLLAKSAPLQGIMLLLVGPFLDKLISGVWVHEYEYNVPALGFLAASCLTAVLVNVSQFFCLGRFSAVTFQVLGHMKTVLVLLGGWVILKDPYTVKQVGGASVAVFGMILYGLFASKAPRPQQQPIIVSISNDARITP